MKGLVLDLLQERAELANPLSALAERRTCATSFVPFLDKGI